MSTSQVLSGRSLLWRGRLHRALSGLQLATSLQLLVVALSSIPYNSFPVRSLAWIARSTVRDFAQVTLLSAPLVLLLVVALNASPARRWLRWAWLLAIAALFAAGCGWASQNTGHMPKTLLDASLEFTPIALLQVVLYEYNRAVLAASEALLRARIDHSQLESELTQARLQLLRAQVEPHFLFNTLATVRRLAQLDRAAAVALIDNLVRYFTAALPKLRRAEAPLAEEMELVRSYLDIHSVRMGTRLNYEIVLPEELARVTVPSMALLTLAENALKHGVNPLAQGGFIRVSAVRDRARVLLQVADNGRGMAPGHGHGTGLDNIRTRLAIRFGAQASLAIEAARPRGVVATISIPDLEPTP